MLVRFALIPVLVTCAILFVMGWTTYSKTMGITPRCDVSVPNVTFPSRSDGLTIAGRSTSVVDDKGTVLLVHGLDTCKDDPRLVVTEQAYQDMGYATLAIDMRSHGASAGGGAVHGFGSLRARDVLGAFDWLTGQGVAADRIIIHGQSLGGSAVLLAAATDPTIARVVAEDAILNFDMTLTDGGAPRWFLPVFKMVARLRGFDLSRQPVAACDTTKGLIVHTTDDPVTPVAQLDFAPDDQDACTVVRVTGDWHIGWAGQQPQVFKDTLERYLR